MVEEKRHFLVPKHTILPPEKENEILKKFHTTKDDLATILYSDPMVKKLKAKIGDIIEIERESPIAGKSIYYRVVR
ncbi:MAG: DNA-directed RNA polymerase subunit H [Candidatus Diapherotrites archaeon]|nr:DNA-directed RNA polymerase subunit H [Candidatus Diapherotrites archaeon]